MKVQYRITLGVLLVILAVIFLKLLIGGSTVALFAPGGPIAAQEKNLIIDMVLLMLVVVVPMFVLLFTFAWKYRAGNKKAKYDPEQEHGASRELIIWAVPALLVVALGILAWKNAHALDPYQPIDSSAPPLTIEVVALPWKWLFIYPAQNIATVNFIQFPVNTPVHFELTADAPMSSFWIPQLGSQIYAMAAMETQLNLVADKIGDFTGKDTEINGEGYAGMTFTARSSSQSDFDAWVQSVQTSSTYPSLTSDAYTALSAPSSNNPPAYYSSVEGDMFDNIMMKFMVPSSTASSSQTMPGMQMTPDMQM